MKRERIKGELEELDKEIQALITETSHFPFIKRILKGFL